MCCPFPPPSSPRQSALARPARTLLARAFRYQRRRRPRVARPPGADQRGEPYLPVALECKQFRSSPRDERNLTATRRNRPPGAGAGSLVSIPVRSLGLAEVVLGLGLAEAGRPQATDLGHCRCLVREALLDLPVSGVVLDVVATETPSDGQPLAPPGLLASVAEARHGLPFLRRRRRHGRAW